MGQRAERGTNGPETLPEGEPAAQARATHKWALGGQVAGRRDSVGWNDRMSVQMGGPRDRRGLPDTKARTARLRSPFIHDQQSNLQSTTYGDVRSVCQALECYGSFPAQP